MNEIKELRGVLSGTAFRLERETAELHGRVEMERLRHREVEQLFGTLHADHYGSVAALWDVYRRLNEDIDVLGLQWFIPYSAFHEGS